MTEELLLYLILLALGCVGLFNLGRIYENIVNLCQETREKTKKGDTDEQNDR
jgi:hypothetical protein